MGTHWSQIAPNLTHLPATFMHPHSRDIGSQIMGSDIPDLISTTGQLA